MYLDWNRPLSLLLYCCFKDGLCVCVWMCVWVLLYRVCACVCWLSLHVGEFWWILSGLWAAGADTVSPSLLLDGQISVSHHHSLGAPPADRLSEGGLCFLIKSPLFLASSPLHQYVVFIFPSSSSVSFWQLAFRRHLSWEYSSVNQRETSLTVVFKPREELKRIRGRGFEADFFYFVSLFRFLYLVTSALSHLQITWGEYRRF